METLEKGRPFNVKALLVSLSLTFVVGAVASYVTLPQIAGWYRTLQKPSFNPPNWLFGPVWTLLYIMIAIAAYLIWQRRSHDALYKKARLIYFVQLFLNFSWSIVFFGLHQVIGALVVIGLLWVSIIFTIYCFSKINRIAAWLLVPYLCWVSFASVLNLYIYLLNA